jgi:hypothetical protein
VFLLADRVGLGVPRFNHFVDLCRLVQAEDVNLSAQLTI